VDDFSLFPLCCLQVLVASHGEEENGAEGIAAVDFRGHPVDKTKTGGWLAAGLILGSCP